MNDAHNIEWYVRKYKKERETKSGSEGGYNTFHTCDVLAGSSSAMSWRHFFFPPPKDDFLNFTWIRGCVN